MRKLTKQELLQIKDDLFNGRQFSVSVEDFTFDEFNQQLRDLVDGESSVEVGRRSSSVDEGRVEGSKLEVREPQVGRTPRVQ